MNLLNLKMIDYITGAKNVKKRCTESKDGLIKKFPLIYKFCDSDLNKFVLLLRKGVYPYEYMDSWERFDETSLPDKKAFYSELNLEDITDKGYEHAQKVWEVFEIKNLGEYHDLYVQAIYCSLRMYLKTLEISVLKYMALILLIFCLHRD